MFFLSSSSMLGSNSTLACFNDIRHSWGVTWCTLLSRLLETPLVGSSANFRIATSYDSLTCLTNVVNLFMYYYLFGVY